jgi:2-keto-4-pentenoate hydratase/2-oxohepta-3-ene-1,7-dioic acid hydratase in catechol pathway
MAPPRYLAVGDEVTVEIDRIGALSHRIVAPRPIG